MMEKMSSRRSLTSKRTARKSIAKDTPDGEFDEISQRYSQKEIDINKEMGKTNKGDCEGCVVF